MIAAFPVHGLLILVAVALTLLPPATQAQVIGSDDFDSDSNAAWLADYLVGHGQLARTNGHLEYRVSSPDLLNGDDRRQQAVAARKEDAARPGIHRLLDRSRGIRVASGVRAEIIYVHPR